MQNKPAPKSWNEIEMLISAIAIALTLGLWNLLASSKKPVVASTDANANLPSQTDTSIVAAITPTSSPMLLPGQVLLLGGTVPPAMTQTVGQPYPSTSTTTTSSRSGGGGKGAGTVTKTHSSHP